MTVSFDATIRPVEPSDVAELVTAIINGAVPAITGVTSHDVDTIELAANQIGRNLDGVPKQVLPGLMLAAAKGEFPLWNATLVRPGEELPRAYLDRISEEADRAAIGSFSRTISEPTIFAIVRPGWLADEANAALRSVALVADAPCVFPSGGRAHTWDRAILRTDFKLTLNG